MNVIGPTVEQADSAVTFSCQTSTWTTLLMVVRQSCLHICTLNTTARLVGPISVFLVQGFQSSNNPTLDIFRWIGWPAWDISILVNAMVVLLRVQSVHTLSVHTLHRALHAAASAWVDALARRRFNSVFNVYAYISVLIIFVMCHTGYVIHVRTSWCILLNFRSPVRKFISSLTNYYTPYRSRQTSSNLNVEL